MPRNLTQAQSPDYEARQASPKADLKLWNSAARTSSTHTHPIDDSIISHIHLNKTFKTSILPKGSHRRLELGETEERDLCPSWFNWVRPFPCPPAHLPDKRTQCWEISNRWFNKPYERYNHIRRWPFPSSKENHRDRVYLRKMSCSLKSRVFRH